MTYNVFGGTLSLTQSDCRYRCLQWGGGDDQCGQKQKGGRGHWPFGHFMRTSFVDEPVVNNCSLQIYDFVSAYRGALVPWFWSRSTVRVRVSVWSYFMFFHYGHLGVYCNCDSWFDVTTCPFVIDVFCRTFTVWKSIVHVQLVLRYRSTRSADIGFSLAWPAHSRIDIKVLKMLNSAAKCEMVSMRTNFSLLPLLPSCSETCCNVFLVMCLACD